VKEIATKDRQGYYHPEEKGPGARFNAKPAMAHETFLSLTFTPCHKRDVFQLRSSLEFRLLSIRNLGSTINYK
jgi:hypothetical protein